MRARCLSFLKMQVAVLITGQSRLPQHLTRRKWDTTRLVFYFLLIYLVVDIYFNHNTDNIKLQYQHYAQNNTYSGKVHLLTTIFYITRRFCPISSPPIHSFSLDNFILHVSYLLPSKIRYSAL